jgi:hypothetical protein
VAYGISIASQKEEEEQILHCHMQEGGESSLAAVPPNVSTGLFLLNLEAQEQGLVSGIFYADFLLFLRQHDRPLDVFEGGDVMQQLTFSNAKGVDKVQ